MINLVIAGSGGFAKEVHSIVKDINQAERKWNILGFISTGPPGEVIVDTMEVIGGDDYVLAQREPLAVLLAIGDTEIRKRLTETYRTNATVVFPNIIHPTVTYDPDNTTLGDGNIIAAGASLAPSVKVGDFNVMNMHVIVAHDSVIGDYCSLNPAVNVSGNVTIGDGCVLGSSAVIHQGVNIGDQTILGIGSVLTRSTPGASTYFGNPARKIG